MEEMSLEIAGSYVDTDKFLIGTHKYNERFTDTSLINLGVNVNGTEYYSPLHKACIQGRADIVDKLLKAGAEVNIKDYEDCTPLHYAVDLNKIDSKNRRRRELLRISYGITELLLNHNADVNARDMLEQDPLQLAVKCGNSAACLLLKHGANLGSTDDQGRTPLDLAILAGNINLVKLLLHAGAAPDSTDFYENSALHRAVEQGALMTQMIINFSSKLSKFINAANFNGLSPLHLAARNSDNTIVEMLINRGADIEQMARNNNTPLLYACYSESSANNITDFDERDCQRCKVVRTLLEAGGNIHHYNCDGLNALHMATMQNLASVVKILLENGAPVNGRTCEGETPLHLGVKFGAVTPCVILHKYGADIESRDARGRTPLQMIVYKQNSENRKQLLRLILDWDANINSRNEEGKTLLHLLLETPGWLIEDKHEIILFLLENGAQILSDPTIDKFIENYYKPRLESRIVREDKTADLAFTLNSYKHKMSHIDGKVLHGMLERTLSTKKYLKTTEEIDLICNTLLINNIHTSANILYRKPSLKESWCNIQTFLLNDNKMTDSLEKKYLINRMNQILRRVKLLRAGYLLFEYLNIQRKYPKLIYLCSEAIICYLSTNDLRNISQIFKVDSQLISNNDQNHECDSLL